ncbi:nicotinamidase [Erwinia sp. OLTSP20]|uniref:bifunctional nicotinamidase/pyrazinamidase n=1 Tax=unclassified Erwinia TaxID=2622719 RepID=UPI000C1810D3|nr:MULTISPECIES: bifunctional nicotinamidase/pyrazinamidase [unclassified Erwinia]PIJ51635.1 nicotinamidase [Erwinia sp. OAMSP11]PIJ69712.1 nicotinamidase [Erwinia sp. OLSSP12]PIJ79435.1 nicotinamidase [Erwinia sp. OLCASP19]PIJ86605.1 nicotinamidase [Erwinia sp. OLMTSP26]PIJ88046.1 nicotinamidase [Erwinia sp. OLMDSP33]
MYRHHALLLIDIQNDFCPGDALAVPGGDRVVDVANHYIAQWKRQGGRVIASQDWHPANHGSFAVNAGAPVGDSGQLNGIEQVWWPVHCVQNSPGAAFHPSLTSQYIDLIIHKGMDPAYDSYSAFRDNGHQHDTGLDSWLRQHQITTLTIMGLATDYCVRFSVIDALSAGYQVNVITAGCRGVNLKPDDSVLALSEMQQKGAQII